jgi:hypothetical protein
MALATGGAATAALRARLGPRWVADASTPPAGGPRLDDPDAFGLAPQPPGVAPGDVPDWLWTVPPDAPALRPLRDPSAYLLPDPAGLLHESPYRVLFDPVQRGVPLDRARVDYCRRSADVTMRGGATSGVVYPLAVCEIARHHRLRSVGGASAGAIAAALAAAAETGRTALAEGEAEPGAPTAGQLDDGSARTGFAGLADVLAWLAEVDEPPRRRHLRIGQLLRPGAGSMPLYRIAVAGLRKRWWALPLLAGGASGRLSRVVTWLLVLTAAVLLGGQREKAARTGAGLARTVVDAAAGALGLVATTGVLVGAGWTALALRRWLRPRPARPPELAEPVAPGPRRPPLDLRPLGVLGAGLLLGWPALRLGLPGWGLLAAEVLLLAALSGVLAASAWSIGARAGRHHYGLVPGSARRQERGLWGRVAGVPAPTVDRPLVPWLSGTLSELAGLPVTTVLRFGHLWWGVGRYRPGHPPPDADEVARDARRRRVDLQLMTSELVQQRAHRFPLLPADPDSGQEQLYVQVTDLARPGCEVFPTEVVRALVDGRPTIRGRDATAGGAVVELCPLPPPDELPVVFAVRLSLSLPGLFEGVRLYRRVRPTTVRDEFGRPLQRDGATLVFPGPGSPDGTPIWVEELWATDGGVTSNFPIHFFDSVLPLWPTFGINLQPHPPGAAHQDVELPQDWQRPAGAHAPLADGLVSFVAAVLATALGWRDAAQSAMPGYRGRVAWVRQGSGEGGVNLFMDRETIATLALRGALAGARLAKRFRADEWWHRHQWLRLRTSLEDLEQLRGTVSGGSRDPGYRALLDDGGADVLQALIDADVRGDPAEPPAGSWYTSRDPGRFFAAAADLREAITGPAPQPLLEEGAPRPAPELRQVPPE